MLHKSPNIYDHFPDYIRDLAGDIKSFKKTPKNYWRVHSFYTMGEFVMYTIRSVYSMVTSLLHHCIIIIIIIIIIVILYYYYFYSVSFRIFYWLF
jgi:hypothetical protein